MKRDSSLCDATAVLHVTRLSEQVMPLLYERRVWHLTDYQRKGGINMGRFLNGVMVGIGIGLLVAPMRGEEMQRLVRQRYEQLRSNLPEKEQLQQAGQQVAAGLSQNANTLKGAAQQAATRVQGTGSALSDLAQQSAQKVKQTGQDVVSTARQTAQSGKQSGQTTTASSDKGTEEMIVFADDMRLDEGMG